MTADLLQSALKAHQAGRLADAEDGYRAVLKRDPRHLDALYLLGLLLYQSGRMEESLLPLGRAVESRHARPEHFNTLGDVNRALGRFDDAITHLERAIALKPGYVDAQLNLGTTLNAVGRKDEALVLLFNAVAANPTSVPLRQLLAAMLQGVVLHTGNAVVREVLRLLCTDDTTSTQSLAGAVLGLVKGNPSFPLLLAAATNDSDPFVVVESAARALMDDALLTTGLPRFIVWDAEVERVLTLMRRWIFRRAMRNAPGVEPDATVPVAFLCALAGQCHNTEFAFELHEDERLTIARLRDVLADALALSHLSASALEPSLTLYALYGPLHDIVGWDRLLDISTSAWSEPFQPLIREQVIEYQAERAIAAQLPNLTPVADARSHRVRDMYETNPYPRWVAIPQPRVIPVREFLRTVRPDDARPTANTSILVAGCGTGQQPVQLAMAHPDASIVAFDLSRASLAYGSRMAARFGVTSVRFLHGDLLELGAEGEFAIVSCVGVLHHLADPLAGLQRLVLLVARDGIMKVGLYSAKARTAVEAARTFARERRFPDHADGLRACRQAIMALPSQHPARGVMAFADFFSLSGCRDLVMHVQEHTFTIPDLARALDAMHLQFLGFQLPQTTQVRFAAEQGNDALLDLAAWDRFEQAHPDTFAAMYQFWCRPRQTSL